MKTPILIFMLLLSYSSFAQRQKQDIIFDSTTYHYVSYYPNGKMKSVSEHSTEKEGGKWIYFNSAGEELWRGSFNKKGNKDGEWWYRKKEITTFKNGKEMKKGIGCNPCPE